MTTQVAVPAEAKVAGLVETLLGRGVTLDGGADLALDGSQPVVLGVYRDAAGAIGGVIASDLELSAISGAALALMPIGAVQAAVAAGALTEALLENFSEVLNVASRLLNEAGHRRLILREVVSRPQQAIPVDARSLVERPALRQAWTVAVDGYGTGRLAILVG